MAGLDEAKRAWLQRVLGVTLVNASGASDLVGRLAEATKQVDRAKAEGGPALPTLLNIQANAMRAVQAGDPKAGPLLDLLERELARAATAARTREAEEVSAGVVDYAKLLLTWRDAQAKVEENLQTLSQAILNHPDLEDDDDPDEIRELAADIPLFAPEFGGELADLLDAARKPGADVAALHREALDTIDEYRDALKSVAELRELERLAALAGAGDLGLYRELSGALGALQAQLEQADS